MSAKFSEARRNAFLKALRETGNQTLAAEAAKVSRAWVQLQRKSDPEFKRRIEEAVKVAKAALRSFDRLRTKGERKSGTRPPPGWAFAEGEELVLRGTGGSGGGKRVQVARARLHQWTPRVEERFLQVLAVTGNARAAWQAVGMSRTFAYNHRNRHPAFAERWEEAVEASYDRVDGGLTVVAIRLRAPRNLLPPPAMPPLTPMTVDQAIWLVRTHDRRRREGG